MVRHTGLLCLTRMATRMATRRARARKNEKKNFNFIVLAPQILSECLGLDLRG